MKDSCESTTPIPSEASFHSPYLLLNRKMKKTATV